MMPNKNDTWIIRCRAYLWNKHDIEISVEHAYDILCACFEDYDVIDDWCLCQHIDDNLDEIKKDKKCLQNIVFV